MLFLGTMSNAASSEATMFRLLKQIGTLVAEESPTFNLTNKNEQSKVKQLTETELVPSVSALWLSFNANANESTCSDIYKF